jgi:hypothetical protein
MAVKKVNTTGVAAGTGRSTRGWREVIKPNSRRLAESEDRVCWLCLMAIDWAISWSYKSTGYRQHPTFFGTRISDHRARLRGERPCAGQLHGFPRVTSSSPRD